jgi:hypothetical protein
MKDLLSFSEIEKKNLKIGLLILIAVLLLSNIQSLYQGVAALPIWQIKPRQAKLSPNFKPPVYYEGELNDLGMARFVSLDVLVVVYKKIDEFELSQTSVDEIRQGTKLAREFFWRNSRLQLNINPEFLEVEDTMPLNLVDEQGKIWPKSGLLEEDLLTKGVRKNQYDVVFLLYPYPNAVSGSGMELRRLGKTAYSFASLPTAETENIYPDGPELTWVFASQLWYSINTIVYDRDSEEITDWPTLATTLRQYSIQDPPKTYGKIYLTLDFDLDGVPDDEPMVPFYEVSLGLNRETNDSDGDGLGDMQEITAGIFRSTDLFLQDTDGDGLKDGEDPDPFQPQ